MNGAKLTVQQTNGLEILKIIFQKNTIFIGEYTIHIGRYAR